MGGKIPISISLIQQDGSEFNSCAQLRFATSEGVDLTGQYAELEP